MLALFGAVMFFIAAIFSAVGEFNETQSPLVLLGFGFWALHFAVPITLKGGNAQ